jgi:DMSO reductase family type II enzyme heme b subunit
MKLGPKLTSASALVVAAFLVAVAMTIVGVVPAASQEATIRVWQTEPSDELSSPWSSIWKDVSPTSVALTGQNATKPFGGGEIATVRVRALHDTSRLYIMLEWKDATQNETVIGHREFADAAAVQFPSVAGVSVPSFCMGDADGTVNIWHWKAAWQRDIDVGFASVIDRYPNTAVDGYPHAEEAVYAPARQLGNPFAQHNRVSPVENLVAGSFGTLTTANVQDVDGAGEWRDGRWRVVFSRSLRGSDGYPTLAIGDWTNVAFAVWDGEREQRDGIKSLSQFASLVVTASVLEPSGEGFPWWAWGLAGIALVALLAGLAVPFLRSGRG